MLDLLLSWLYRQFHKHWYLVWPRSLRGFLFLGNHCEPAPLAPPLVTVKIVHEKTGTKKDGTPWTAYFVLLNDGINDLEVATFSKTTAGIANSLAESGMTAEATIKPGNKAGSFELVNLLPKEGPKSDDDVPM